jgi:hypothetical protein
MSAFYHFGKACRRWRLLLQRILAGDVASGDTIGVDVEEGRFVLS